MTEEEKRASLVAALRREAAEASASLVAAGHRPTPSRVQYSPTTDGCHWQLAASAAAELSATALAASCQCHPAGECYADGRADAYGFAAGAVTPISANIACRTGSPSLVMPPAMLPWSRPGTIRPVTLVQPATFSTATK